MIDSVFIGFPKINYLDSNDKFDSIANLSNDVQDLSFYWKNSIDIKYLNNNYLGPNVNAVIHYYDKLLDK